MQAAKAEALQAVRHPSSNVKRILAGLRSNGFALVRGGDPRTPSPSPTPASSCTQARRHLRCAGTGHWRRWRGRWRLVRSRACARCGTIGGRVCTRAGPHAPGDGNRAAGPTVPLAHPLSPAYIASAPTPHHATHLTYPNALLALEQLRGYYGASITP